MGEDELKRQPFYGQRLDGLKVHRNPDRHPKTGQRFFHHNPDGSFVNQNQKEESQMESIMFKNVESLKKYRPDLYAEIQEDGRQAGIAERAAKAKQAAAEQEAAEAKAAAAEVQRLRGIEEANKFESKVAKLRAEGVALGTAITRVALEDPKAHQDYLDRVQAGQAGKLG